MVVTMVGKSYAWLARVKGLRSAQLTMSKTPAGQRVLCHLIVADLRCSEGEMWVTGWWWYNGGEDGG